MDYLSTFRIPIDKIPEAKNWKVGGKYQIVAHVEQTGVNKERDYGSESPTVEGSRKKSEPKFRTMVEFKVRDVEAKKRELSKRM